MFFDGVDDYVLVPHSPSLMPPNVSANVWFAPLSLADDFIRLLEKGGWAVGGGCSLEINPGFRPVVRFNVWYGSTAYTLDSTTRLSTGTWFHVAGVFNGVGMRLYVNLGLEGSSGASISANTWGLYIGRRAVNPGDFFSGYMAQILIYSRALSDSEILFNYSNPDNPVRNGLVLWLQAHPDYIKDIDGDGILEWIDLSGFNNHGKIYGARLVELIRAPVRTLTVARTVPVAR
jgi:hypothetical protein